MAGPGTGTERRVHTVAEVNALVSGFLRERFGDVWIEGEVSNFKRYPSGHLYFTLRDSDSQLAAVCFKHSAARLRFDVEDGMKLVVHGRLEVYAASGKYQVVVDAAEPKGVGALQLAFEQLKRRLEAEGLFADKRKRQLPALPRVVGIVTSPVGAAIHDMLRTLRLHGAPVRVVLYPAQVQGDGAAGQIAEGIATLAGRPDVEVIIVGRGGGSIEDLWPFNEEQVARAIAASRVPIVSGIGHEVDFTIADFVADLRAATPTAAAQRIAAGWEDLGRRIAEQALALAEAGQERVARGQERLLELTGSRAFELIAVRLAEAGRRVEQLDAAIAASAGGVLRVLRGRLDVIVVSLNRTNPVARVIRHGARLSGLLVRLPAVWRDGFLRRKDVLCRLVGRADRPVVAALAAAGSSLAERGAKLNALSPLASLGRGYAICRRGDGEVVKSIRQVAPGVRLHVRVTDGSIGADVCETASVDPGSG